MKKLLILLFSILLISSPSVFADDISDFQIEGISIGDSLLDYMTEEEILEEIEITKDHYSYLEEPNKYAEVYLSKKDFLTFKIVSFFIKNNASNKYLINKNEKYTILSIYGAIPYIEDIDGCIQKRDEIVEVVSNMFPDAQKTESVRKHPLDPSGRSFTHSVYFILGSGATVDAYCSNWEENFRVQNNYSEGLNFGIKSQEIHNWL